MKTHRIHLALAALSVLGLQSAAAHPGHGHSDASSVEHFATEPQHAFFMIAAAALVVGITCITCIARRRSTQTS
jgi:hypothetical protein